MSADANSGRPEVRLLQKSTESLTEHCESGNSNNSVIKTSLETSFSYVSRARLAIIRCGTFPAGLLIFLGS
jgi:hypothetical protein